MKAWRFYGFNDMRLDEVPQPRCGPGQVIAEVLCVQPSVTEAQLAQGIPTLAYDRVKRRLETEPPVQLFGHEFCARIVEVGPGVTRFRPGDRVAARAKLKLGDEINPRHGLGGEGHKHEGFQVVGILKPTGTANDRAVFINIDPLLIRS